MAHRFQVGCPPKTRAMEVQFDDLSAGHRLINFTLTGATCAVPRTTGFTVTSRSGRSSATAARSTPPPEVPLVGGIKTEVCG